MYFRDFSYDQGTEWAHPWSSDTQTDNFQVHVPLNALLYLSC